MYALEEFARQCGMDGYLSDEDNGLHFVVDSSGFNYVDGEEGDNGINKYYHNDHLFAIHYIYGGDSDDIVFTKYAVELMKPIIFKKFEENANSIDIFEE